MEEKTPSQAFLGTEPVGKLLFRLALPAIAAQLINVLYNIVDRVYLGHIPGVGGLALTGVGVCSPIILIISAFAALVSMGGAPLASIELGKQNQDGAKRIMGSCFALQVVLSLVLTAACLLWSEPLLRLFGASENTLSYAAEYMSVYALGTLFVQLTLGMNAFISAEGFATTGMLTTLIGAVCNIIRAQSDHLPPSFALGMGLRGAALATRPFSGRELYLGAGLSPLAQIRSAAVCGDHSVPAGGTAVLHGAGGRALYHAGQREHHFHLLQLLPAEIWRGRGGGCYDHPLHRLSVRHAPYPRTGSGSTAHFRLQLWCPKRGTGEKNLPAAPALLLHLRCGAVGHH